MRIVIGGQLEGARQAQRLGPGIAEGGIAEPQHAEIAQKPLDFGKETVPVGGGILRQVVEFAKTHGLIAFRPARWKEC